MTEPQDILAAVTAAAGGAGVQTTTRAWDDLAGRHVLVTAGPTHEPIDPVRYVGNRSSGKMGVAIAAEAHARGARVTLVLVPARSTHRGGRGRPDPDGGAAPRGGARRAEAADAIVMAAAVADFRPKTAADAEAQEGPGVPELLLEAHPDVLSELGERKRPGQVLVGFAAETHDVEAAGRDKLARKHADLLVANLVGRRGTGSARTRMRPRSSLPGRTTSRCRPGRNTSWPRPSATGSSRS